MLMSLQNGRVFFLFQTVPATKKMNAQYRNGYQPVVTTFPYAISWPPPPAAEIFRVVPLL